MERDRRLTGFMRGQTDKPVAPPGFELNNPWRVCIATWWKGQLLTVYSVSSDSSKRGDRNENQHVNTDQDISDSIHQFSVRHDVYPSCDASPLIPSRSASPNLMPKYFSRAFNLSASV